LCYNETITEQADAFVHAVYAGKFLMPANRACSMRTMLEAGTFEQFCVPQIKLKDMISK